MTDSNNECKHEKLTHKEAGWHKFSYWEGVGGYPVPIYSCDKCDEEFVAYSRQEE